MPELKWKTISVPRTMLEEIEKYLTENPIEGICSAPEFVRVATREHLRRKGY